jgi:hypothetical protein
MLHYVEPPALPFAPHNLRMRPYPHATIFETPQPVLAVMAIRTMTIAGYSLS